MNEPASRHSSANIPYSALRPSSPADRDLQGRHSCRAQTRAVFFKSLFERPCAKYKRKYARVSKTANYTHGQTSEEAIELYNGGHLNVYGTTCQHISINTSKRWPIYI